VGEQSQASQRTFTLEPGRHVIGQRDHLKCRTEYKLSGVKHKRFVRFHLDQTSQFRLIKSRVDVLVLVVVKQAKETVKANINARGLNHSKVEGI
jgi:hypothetical protein